MYKTKRLEQLGGYIAEHPINWDRFINRFINYESFGYDNVFTLDQYVDYFKQIFLNDCLEEIAEKHPELGISFEAHPKEGYKSKHFVFHYDKVGRLWVYINSPKEKYRFPRKVYNRVIMVDKKPVVFDMKILPWSGYGRVRKRRNNHGINVRCIRDFLKPYNYLRKLRPLREVYHENCISYIVIIPKDVYQQKNDHEISRGFLMDGGMIVPFYTGRLQFRQEVGDMVAQYGLKIKD